jgi:hypothetical protein
MARRIRYEANVKRDSAVARIAVSNDMRQIMDNVGNAGASVARQYARYGGSTIRIQTLITPGVSGLKRWAVDIWNTADSAKAQEYGSGNMPRLAPLGRALDEIRRQARRYDRLRREVERTG